MAEKRKDPKDEQAAQAQVETDQALTAEREAEAARAGRPANQPDPGRNADRSDDEQDRAEKAERDRPRDAKGNHARRQDAPDDPNWRGVSGDDEPEDRPDEGKTRRAIFEAQGLTEEEADLRLRRDRGYSDDQPLVSHREAFETGYAGQVPDPTLNEAYTVSGQASGEAAAADHRAATRGRDGDEGAELARRVAQRRGGAAAVQPGQDADDEGDQREQARRDERHDDEKR